MCRVYFLLYCISKALASYRVDLVGGLSVIRIYKILLSLEVLKIFDLFFLPINVSDPSCIFEELVKNPNSVLSYNAISPSARSNLERKTPHRRKQVNAPNTYNFCPANKILTKKALPKWGL